MKENYNRRKFLKASILGIGAFFVDISPLKSFAASASAPAPADVLDAGLLYAQAKDFFYKKEYGHAASLYRQLIGRFPGRYIYYDGYARVLGAEQKVLEAAELYREGWLKNQDNPYFMQRLALRIYDLCLGSRKAEIEFCRKHGYGSLLEASAGLLLDAVRIKPDKGFYLSLRDVLRAVERKNIYLEAKNIAPIHFPEQLEKEILQTASRFDAVWEKSRSSRKPPMPEDVEAQIEKINKRRRRHFHDKQEQKEFDKAVRKARKHCKKHAVESGLKLNNAEKVERYAMSVLEENIDDTDTIGKLRGYYRKMRKYDKIITLNRYLYNRQPSYAHSLALAGSLARYGKNAKDFNEALALLKPLAPMLETMNPVHASTYYIGCAQACAKTNNVQAAKETLLQGMAHLHHNTGKTYVLLEQYALVCGRADKKSIGTDLLKTLCGRPALAVDRSRRYEKDDRVWAYADKYMSSISTKKMSPDEQLKPLRALLKLQNGKSGDYRKIEAAINEIKGLRSSSN